jgi:hypothetical protein
MNRNDIESLIGILENELNQAEGAIQRFVIWQELKSLRQELESMQDTSPCFY